MQKTMEYGEHDDVSKLELENIIGFNGKVSGGLNIHPDSKGGLKIIYPLGCTVIIENLDTNQQEFLSGHSDEVTCLAVSKSGKYIASGQRTYMGFKADINIWDWETRSLFATLTLHKVKVQALAFSLEENYLVSLGGEDDGSVVVWNIATKTAICGSPAQVVSAGNTLCVCFSKVKNDIFVTGGKCTLRVWKLDVKNRKIRSSDVNMGQLKRNIKCIEMADDYAESYFLCGTDTGDVIGVNLESQRFQFLGPVKGQFSLGVTSLTLLQHGKFIIGAGDGTVCEAKFDKPEKSMAIELVKLREWRNPKYKSHSKGPAITSVAKRGKGHQLYIGTDGSEILRLTTAEKFSGELIKTCHSKAVNDTLFPENTSELFLTCQDSEIRVWHLGPKKELIRHVVPNMTCNAMDITADGKTIFSAWSDGKIRAFGIDSSEPKLVIEQAHKSEVSSMKCTRDGQFIVSGGSEGQVRIWKILEEICGRKKKKSAELLSIMKEHNSEVSDIKLLPNDKECVSASKDGTCIIWDLEEYNRKQIVFANTLFKSVCYGDKGIQIIASGTDRKIGYWDCFDGTLIRQVDGSKSGSVNTMDISADCMHFISGGDDKLLKVWKYDQAEVTHVGIGHAGAIKKARICPNKKKIVSVSDDGAILIWKFPSELS